MLTQQDLETLTTTFLFKGYAPSSLEPLLAQAAWEVRVFPKGNTIYSPGDFRKELGILLQGRVLVTKGELVVSELAEGDLFGAAALFNEEEDYVSTLTARSKCRILFFSQDAVQTLIDREARIQRSYIRYLSGRIRFLSGKIDALIQGSSEKKLSDYLLRQMDGDGNVAPACSMTELAMRLNMGRASLYRELQKLEDRGILSRDGKTIVIHAPELLARL